MPKVEAEDALQGVEAAGLEPGDDPAEVGVDRRQVGQVGAGGLGRESLRQVVGDQALAFGHRRRRSRRRRSRAPRRARAAAAGPRRAAAARRSMGIAVSTTSAADDRLGGRAADARTRGPAGGVRELGDEAARSGSRSSRGSAPRAARAAPRPAPAGRRDPALRSRRWPPLGPPRRARQPGRHTGAGAGAQGRDERGVHDRHRQAGGRVVQHDEAAHRSADRRLGVTRERRRPTSRRGRRRPARRPAWHGQRRRRRRRRRSWPAGATSPRPLRRKLSSTAPRTSAMGRPSPATSSRLR